jgi:hypothetical protein
MKKSHLFFRNPPESTQFKQRTRFPGREEESEDKIEDNKDYSFMKSSFAYSLSNFNAKKIEREKNRNVSLVVPAKIDYIIIYFYDYFDSSKYDSAYHDKFGLSPILFDQFNTIGYFAISDTIKFENFTKSIESFINSDNPKELEDIVKLIFYIKNFAFHSSEDIKKFSEPKSFYALSLFDSLELYNQFDDIRRSLIQYCEQRKLKVILDIPSNRIELINAPLENINDIVNNYDIIYTVSSPNYGVIKPSRFNIPIREYGFEIVNSTEELPVIGIIDTGISNQTPLLNIIINQGNEFDDTGTHPLVDNANHGTAVAAIAALGKSLYGVKPKSIKADAKLLSIKIIDGSSGHISETTVCKLISEAHAKYGVKIFVLTIGQINPLNDNSLISNYAYSLDSLSKDLDILIFISVGNYEDSDNYYDSSGKLSVEYPNQFRSGGYNINSPSDSMNNISCGAIASNLEPYNIDCFSDAEEFPASYTRKLNINRSAVNYNANRVSKHITKPDLCYYGGDIDFRKEIINTGLNILSAQTGIFYDRGIGTSLSAPFLANLAAKILKTYPSLKNNMQTVKALIINSAYNPSFGSTFNNLKPIKIEDLIGKGIPDELICIYSDENRITFVLEDSINPGDIKAYPLKIPEYLSKELKAKSVLHLDATLCFNFEPIQDNHLCYCPIHMSFGIFKNSPLLDTNIKSDGKVENIGLSGGKVDDYAIFKSWSEDYFYKPKLLSNSQKISFNVKKQKLIDQNGSFKIAVESKIHKLLRNYNATSNTFSLVITLREIPFQGQVSNKLYEELIAINNLETIVSLEGEAEIELEN